MRLRLHGADCLQLMHQVVKHGASIIPPGKMFAVGRRFVICVDSWSLKIADVDALVRPRGGGTKGVPGIV